MNPNEDPQLAQIIAYFLSNLTPTPIHNTSMFLVSGTGSYVNEDEESGPEISWSCAFILGDEGSRLLSSFCQAIQTASAKAEVEELEAMLSVPVKPSSPLLTSPWLRLCIIGLTAFNIGLAVGVIVKLFGWF